MVDQAEIHRKVASGDVGERREGMEQLRRNFGDLPDNDAAWKDLIQLTGDADSGVRQVAAIVLDRAFQHVSDKDAAWKDMIRLTGDADSGVRLAATFTLIPTFQHVPDKDAAWKDIIRLTGDADRGVRRVAALVLEHAFQHVSDKVEAWEDLHRLTGNAEGGVRQGAANALGSAFQYIPDKDEAWKDLIRLTGDEESSAPMLAAFKLGSAFQYVPDKDEAWEDLHRLTGDADSGVRRGAAKALGSAFQLVLDKDEVWKDLHRLTGDEDSNVRGYANHSLGRASIFKATVAESEGDFESELNNAIKFFETSSDEAGSSNNPSNFCLPFYRSFYTITFGKARTEGEVQRYIKEAKSASKGSKNKETLLEAVENLASALSEAHKARDFDAIKSDLNTYRQYCDRATDLIGNASEGAPSAAQVLRRGLPIIDDRIKKLLEEVRDKAEIICKAVDLPESELGCRIGQHVATASATDNPIILEREIDYILNDLERWSHSRDEIEKGYVQGIIFDAKNGDARCKVSSIRILLGRFLTFSEDRGEKMPKYDIKDSIIQIAEGNGNVQEMDSSVNSRKVETESGDVNITYSATVTEEPKLEKHRIDQQKRTAIEIFADVSVHVLVYTVLHHFAEDLMPVIAPILVLTAVIILLLIIRNAKSR